MTHDFWVTFCYYYDIIICNICIYMQEIIYINLINSPFINADRIIPPCFVSQDGRTILYR